MLPTRVLVRLSLILIVLNFSPCLSGPLLSFNNREMSLPMMRLLSVSCLTKSVHSRSVLIYMYFFSDMVDIVTLV